MNEGALRWIREEFPSQLIDAIEIKAASPETYESTMKEITGTLVGVIGRSFAMDILAELILALNRT